MLEGGARGCGVKTTLFPRAGLLPGDSCGLAQVGQDPTGCNRLDRGLGLGGWGKHQTLLSTYCILFTLCPLPT